MITELTQDWGTRLLEGRNKTLCPPGPGRKEQGPHKGLTQTCPWVSLGVPVGGVGHQCADAGLGALSAAVPAWDPWKEVAIIFITSTLVLSQVKQQGGKQPCPSTENWIKPLLGMVPPIRTRPSFPTVSLSQQEASLSLLSLSVKGACRMKTSVTGSLSN